MSNEEFKNFDLYFQIITLFFGTLIGFFFLIPKFNPKRQYEDLEMSPFSKQAYKLYFQGILAFVLGFGGIMSVLYLIMWLDGKGII